MNVEVIDFLLSELVRAVVVKPVRHGYLTTSNVRGIYWSGSGTEWEGNQLRFHFVGWGIQEIKSQLVY